MSVRIDQHKCNGCRGAKESLCERICPQNLLFRLADGKAQVRDPRDCWDCAACVKECPRQAIVMYLPAQLGGRGATLQAIKKDNSILWILTRPDGENEIFEVFNETIL